MANSNVNVVVRNYVMSAEELRKRLKVKDGGDRFLIGMKTGASDMPTLLLCQREY